MIFLDPPNSFFCSLHTFNRLSSISVSPFKLPLNIPHIPRLSGKLWPNWIERVKKPLSQPNHAYVTTPHSPHNPLVTNAPLKTAGRHWRFQGPCAHANVPKLFFHKSEFCMQYMHIIIPPLGQSLTTFIFDLLKSSKSSTHPLFRVWRNQVIFNHQIEINKI